MLKLKKIKFFRLLRPLNYQFETSFTVREYISHVIGVFWWKDIQDKEIISYGESTTHSEPFYNEEFDLTVLAYLNRISPKLLQIEKFESPEDLLM